MLATLMVRIPDLDGAAGPREKGQPHTRVLPFTTAQSRPRPVQSLSGRPDPLPLAPQIGSLPRVVFLFKRKQGAPISPPVPRPSRAELTPSPVPSTLNTFLWVYVGFFIYIFYTGVGLLIDWLVGFFPPKGPIGILPLPPFPVP
ncbi:hypothetical protein KIL84_005809 [Mauremys mutica]|uniref:Uncharacterized protein n=1 Tax=Mauremys mutica TaxID=74926 RepID=A0A9D4B425_9SAUR|nr:hypothetical protein KIL84_005809 [Mauremys mutica]